MISSTWDGEREGKGSQYSSIDVVTFPPTCVLGLPSEPVPQGVVYCDPSQASICGVSTVSAYLQLQSTYLVKLSKIKIKLAN